MEDETPLIDELVDAGIFSGSEQTIGGIIVTDIDLFLENLES